MKSLPLLLFALFFCFSCICQAQDTNRIARIEVTGNEKIDRGVVLNAIKTKENDPYDLRKLREDMKAIYRIGSFSDVQIDVEDTEKGKVITFVVIERPTISAVYLSGNKNLKTSEIREKMKVQSNQVLNIEKVKESMDEIRKFYSSKGYYATKVSYEIEYGDRYDVSVRFLVEEPPKAYVKKIDFTGNKAFKASVLKDYMRTKEKGLLSWFTGSGILDEEALEDDKKNVEAYYNDHGYMRVRVGTPDVVVSKDGKAITITLPVEEGNVYKVGNITLSGDTLFPTDEVLKQLKTQPGATFRASLFQEDLLHLMDLYRDKGYAFCEVNPLTLLNDNAQTVDITFDIAKGKEIYFNRINVIGNVKTRDKVIRRELKVAEGDRFSAYGLKESQRRLRNTAFFKSVDMKIAKTDEPDKINLDVTIEERPTGSLNVGIGYNTDEGVILSGSVAQDNFLGTGKKVVFDASFSGVSTQYRLSFFDPYILDYNMGLGLSLFNFGRSFDTYEYRKLGGGFSLSRPMTDFVKAGMAYRYESTKVFNVDASASSTVKEQEGTTTTSAVTFSLSKNTIDDILNPSKGYNTQISLEFAGGPLGGNNSYVKPVGYYGRYFPLKFMESAFFVRGTAGTIQEYGGRPTPIYEKFFVGGIDTVRGFKYGMAGPTDSSDEPIGAKNELFFNFEWQFPIWKPAGIKGVFFYDLGAGSDDSSIWLFNGLRQAAGMGLRWFSPMGPIRIEWGFNLSPKRGESKSQFDFAVGTVY